MSERGLIPVEALAGAVRDHSDDHVSRLALVCLENTHNRHGGAVIPLGHVRAMGEAARARGIALHLDGARLWNASVASGVPIGEWAECATTVSMCFSKGLGAPVGSILIGPAPLIRRARRTRKRWGGAMRQVGILAAACLHALDQHRERLAEDHRRARALAQGLGALPGIVVQAPETNIVLVDLEHPGLARDRVRDAMAARGVLVWPFGPRRLRLMTHLDVDDVGVDRGIAAFGSAIEEALSAPAAGRWSRVPASSVTHARSAPAGGTLFLVATPIGNLEDITQRALRTLGEVAAVAAEDTRRTRRLLAHYGISAPVVSLFEHNERRRVPGLVRRLAAGESLALVTDAGSPGIADPGYRLVRAATEAGLRVESVPGASAVIAALQVSGLPTDAFTFAGFLPVKAGARRRRLEELAERRETLIVFEAPHRIEAALGDLEAVWGARPIALVRELTKVFEEVLRGSPGAVREALVAEKRRGEMVLVLSGRGFEPPAEEDA